MKGIVLVAPAELPPLAPLHDKPLICYPLATLLSAGIGEILIIAPPREVAELQNFLGGGDKWGAAICYAPSSCADARALGVASEFLGGRAAVVIIAHYVFHGGMLTAQLQNAAAIKKGARVFAVRDGNDARRALPGVGCYDANLPAHARALPQSSGLVELNHAYRARGELHVETLGDEVAWNEASTPSALRIAEKFVREIESRDGVTLGCLEESARRGGLTGDGDRDHGDDGDGNSHSDYDSDHDSDGDRDRNRDRARNQRQLQ